VSPAPAALPPAGKPGAEGRRPEGNELCCRRLMEWLNDNWILDIVRNQWNQLFVAAWLVVVAPALAAAGAPAHVYTSTFSQASKLGGDLYETLDAKFQKSIYPEPIKLEQMEAPVIVPVEGGDESKSLREVKISVGFIDLMNHIAHAKAIDRIQPGYFQQYILNLSRVADSDAPPEPPNMVDNRYWTDAVMNEQAGIFNQILGMVMALNLSHHYLGHYTKFSGQMLAGKLVPINTLLAPAEWEASVKAATLNALNCALGTDGPAALFEAIDKMPRRPAWTAFIVPPNTDLKKLSKQLKKYEDDYFHGGLK
jgi:hypothetical protein